MIREITSKMIAFINEGPFNLKDSSAIQEVKESLLLLKGLMVGVM